MKKHISLIFAMQAEAAPLIAKLELKQQPPNPFFRDLPCEIHRGKFRDAFDISITTHGKDARFGMDQIGTEAATIAALATTMILKTDLLINAGTAGSFKSAGAEIGKVYLSRDKFYFHDHRIPIKGWDEMGRGGYPSKDVSAIASELGLELANVSSGNSLDFTDQDLQRIRESGATLKEMEACAIAYVAHLKKIPFFAIKSVTNLIAENADSPAEFEKNFARAVESLTEKTLAILEVLARVGV